MSSLVLVAGACRSHEGSSLVPRPKISSCLEARLMKELLLSLRLFHHHIFLVRLTSEDISAPGASMQKHDTSKKVRQEVWRRYSEFEALRTFLCTVYPYVREGGRGGGSEKSKMEGTS